MTRPNTETSPFIYKTEPGGRFPVSHTRIMDDNTLQAALQGGKLLSLAGGKAGERDREQQKRSGPACFDPEL